MGNKELAVTARGGDTGALMDLWAQVRRLAWTTFVSGIREPELIQYLKERRLYVNEPVQGEEDD